MSSELCEVGFFFLLSQKLLLIPCQVGRSYFKVFPMSLFENSLEWITVEI